MIDVRNKTIIYIFILILLVRGISGDGLTIGYGDESDAPVVVLDTPIWLNITVNSSDYWDGLDTPADIDLTDLGDVNAPTPSNDDVLTYSGGSWINQAITVITDLLYCKLTGCIITGDFEVEGDTTVRNLTIETKVISSLNSTTCYKFKENGDIGVSLAC